MVVSDLTVELVADYIRADVTEETSKIINMCLQGAINYCCSYTGLEKSELDEHADMPLAVLALCAEFYDLRQFTVTTSNNVNRTTAQILDSHSKNLL
ncbi:head-tail connector protein [Veillonella sp.]|uniref:head-tail connector protein n=1 Tax=Veillonella sp. TaxID=1926307 RepID=UPI0025F9E83A|nr:head-tail connector protein [Veillonella sp.]